ncbi:unnamed protein product [Ectocarpus sp. 13 AM-2016]
MTPIRLFFLSFLSQAPSSSNSSMSPTSSPTSAPTWSFMSPTAVPTAAPTAAPTMAAGGDVGATVTGSITVSGVDEETEDEEVYEAAREGLEELFGISSAGGGGVVVGAPGTLDSDKDDDAAAATAAPSPTPIVGTAAGVAADDDIGAGTTEVIGEDGRRRMSERVLPTSSRYDRRDEARTLRHYQPETDLVAEARDPRGGSRGALGGQRRWLQEEEEDSGSETVDMDFEVSVPADDGEIGSSASRVAAMVNEFADSGLAALADSLGVEPEDLRLSDLAFCIGSTNCGNVSTVVSTMSAVDELGTSGPWENFLTNGGLLLLALFGTLCVW